MKRYIGVKIIEAEKCEASKDDQMNKKGDPGYKVVYEGGYVSWSPEDVFEEAYRPIDGMTFGLAIEALKKGLKVARSGWNGKDMRLELQVPDENSKMSLPYIYMFTVQGDLVPWLASQTDMLAEDWMIVK